MENFQLWNSVLERNCLFPWNVYWNDTYREKGELKIFWIPKISHFAYYKKINLVHSYTCNYRKLCQMHTFYRYYYSFFTFLYINRRKYWFLASFRLPVFDGFAHFGMSWSRFGCFWKMLVCLSVCTWQKFCGKCSLRTNAHNLMKLYI